jgi:glycosyltransferase involved in cell wall biosynthesis
LSGRPDLLHDHGIWLWTNHRSAQFAERGSIPRIVSVRGMLEPWALGHHRWRKRLAWRLFQARDLTTARAIHVTSDAEAESVGRRGLGVPIAVVPNGVEIPATLPPRHRGPRRRALFLSRIHPKKGLPLLLDAWAGVRPEGWELVLAGPDDGGHRAELETRVAGSALEATVSFIGPVSDAEKWALYRSADVFVLPTRSENFGLVVAEALAAEVPVLTTRGAPWKELETHSCGWWVEVDSRAVAEGLRQALALSDEERREMGRRGRGLVQARYSWAVAARQMKPVYTWLLGQAPAPECVQTGGMVARA